MPKYCPENESAKRAYTLFLEAASGKQASSADSALRAIERFEISTARKPFKRFHIEQARAFRTKLLQETGPTAKPLSAATVTCTLKHLRNFFLWLSREPGYRRAISANDAAYFTPSEQDRRIATARREPQAASLEDFDRVLSLMPAATPIDCRNRAIIAFALLSGARDGALASFRLRHVDLDRRAVYQDGRDVRTKGRKTFTSHFFPVGPEPLAIFAEYRAMLAALSFGSDDPLFPATHVGRGADRSFEAKGLSRTLWSTTAPIRDIFRNAFKAAGLPYTNPHSVRRTLAQLGERLCRNPEEWKTWSQNLGHEREMTTFVGYGEVSTGRRAEIMSGLSNRDQVKLPNAAEIASLKALLHLIEASSHGAAGPTTLTHNQI